MLKKIIALTACVTLACSVAACGSIEAQMTTVQTGTTATTEASTNTMSTTAISATAASATTAERTAVIPGTTTGFTTTSQGSSFHGDVYYYSFEEMCPKFSDVVIATCESHSDSNWRFEVKEVILGDTENEIFVRKGGTTLLVTSLGGNNGKAPIYYRESDAVFYEKETYLLMLKASSDPYNSAYYTSGAIVIPIDCISQSEMYGESAKHHITGINIDTCTKEDFIEYVRNLVNNTK
jgi:hypothetical protein